MIVVSNTTPLIGLASIKRFDLLRRYFGEIYIPQAVYDEAISAKQTILNAEWVKVVPVQDRLAVDVLLDELDLGEAETIVLAHELNAGLVLVDERKARRKLTQLNFAKTGTVGILLKARLDGLLPVLKSDLEALRQHGFGISQQVIDEVLRQAGE